MMAILSLTIHYIYRKMKAKIVNVICYENRRSDMKLILHIQKIDTDTYLFQNNNWNCYNSNINVMTSIQKL